MTHTPNYGLCSTLQYIGLFLCSMQKLLHVLKQCRFVSMTLKLKTQRTCTFEVEFMSVESTNSQYEIQ